MEQHFISHSTGSETHKATYFSPSPPRRAGESQEEQRPDGNETHLSVLSSPMRFENNLRTEMVLSPRVLDVRCRYFPGS